MNLPYTMVAEQAAEAVKAFRPQDRYPFHYTRGPEPEKFALLADEATSRYACATGIRIGKLTRFSLTTGLLPR